MPIRTALLVPYTAICLLAAACASSTEPSVGAETGRYVATTAGGRALPALLDTSAVDFGVLLADTLDLDGRGGGRRAFALRRASTALRMDTVYHVSVELQYRRVGTRIEVGSFTACPPNALCVANDTGTISGAGIILTEQYVL